LACFHLAEFGKPHAPEVSQSTERDA
jgi:hypothetical protein